MDVGVFHKDGRISFNISMISLKNHPFAVKAFLRNTCVLTFAVPRKYLEPLLPPCFELDLYEGEWGFVVLAIVDTEGLRPAFLPSVLGRNFFLAGYRILVRYQTSAGKRLRGLYVLRSQTDNAWMKTLGGIFTQYKYQHIDVSLQRNAGRIFLNSDAGRFSIVLRELEMAGSELPRESPFNDWKHARRYSGPLPFTFSYLPSLQKVLIVEGQRGAWKPKPVQVDEWQIGFWNELGLAEIQLASAFKIENVPYRWRKGRLDLWQQ